MAQAPALAITLPGTPYNDFPAYGSATDLRAVLSTTLRDQQFASVRPGGVDATGSIYTYTASSLAVDDGLSVIKPNDLTAAQAGRWLSAAYIRLGETGPTGPSDNTYTSYTALLASDPTRMVARLVGDTDVPPQPDGNFSYVNGAWTRQQAVGVNYGRSVNIALPLDRSLPRTLAWLTAVDSLSTASQQSKLADAFTIAKNEGYSVEGLPLANIRKDGVLTLDGVSFDGKGMALTPLSNGPQAIAIVGDGVTVKNLRTISACDERNADVFRNGVTIGIAGASGRTASNITLQDVTVDTVGPNGSTRRGAGNAGIQISNAFRVELVRPKVISSLADGINITGGSQDITVTDFTVDRAGDDGIATNSNISQGALVARVRATGGLILNNLGRGGAIVGGQDVNFQYRVLGSSAAGSYIASEGDNPDTKSGATHGVENCHIHAVMRGCVTGVGLAATFQNALAIIAGRSGTDTIAGVPFSQAAKGCSITGQFFEVGARCSGVIDLTSPYAIRSTVDLLGGNAVGSALMPNGINLGGTDSNVRLRMDALGGLPIDLDLGAAGAAGRLRAHMECTASQTQGAGAINAVCYVNAAPNVEELVVSGTFNNSSTNWLSLNGADPNQLFWKDIVLNGAAFTAKDYTTASVTYANGWVGSTGEPVSVRKFRDGRLLLIGRLNTPTTFAAIIGTTPAGYRPFTAQIWSGTTNGGLGILLRWDVDGTLSLQSATANGTTQGQAGTDVRFNNYVALSA